MWRGRGFSCTFRHTLIPSWSMPVQPVVRQSSNTTQRLVTDTVFPAQSSLWCVEQYFVSATKKEDLNISDMNNISSGAVKGRPWFKITYGESLLNWKEGQVKRWMMGCVTSLTECFLPSWWGKTLQGEKKQVDIFPQSTMTNVQDKTLRV